MLRLIYISRATDGVGNEDVKAILATSVAHNAAVGITGLLVFDGHWFMQALEGPAEAIILLFDRIRNDPRNRNVRVISQEPIDERAFGQWAMAWNPVEPVGAGEPLDRIVAALVQGVEDEELRDAFLRFGDVTAAIQKLSELPSSRTRQ